MTAKVTVGGPVKIQVQQYQPGPISGATLLSDTLQNLQNASASIGQLIASCVTLGIAIPPDWQPTMKAIQSEIDAINSDISTIQSQIVDIQKKQITGTVGITCVGGDTFVFSALSGYPNISCIAATIAATNSNLKIPDSGIFDGQEIEVKILNSAAGGAVVVSTIGGAVLINTGVSPSALSYTIPQTPSVTIYSATFKWSSASGEWEIIATAVR